MTDPTKPTPSPKDADTPTPAPNKYAGKQLLGYFRPSDEQMETEEGMAEAAQQFYDMIMKQTAKIEVEIEGADKKKTKPPKIAR
jgi:hypothetical protein